MSRVVIFPKEAIKAAQRKAIPLVTKVSNQVLAGSKREAPRGDHEHGSGRRVSGPTLQASLHAKALRVTSSMVWREVGSRRAYAATMHEGSRAHVIRAKGKLLKFRWEKGNMMLAKRGRGGRMFFYFRKVNHPGNRRPKRYLMTPLIRYGRAAGFRVTYLPRRSL